MQIKSNRKSNTPKAEKTRSKIKANEKAKKKQPKKATKKQSLRVVALQSSGPHVVEPGKVPKVMSNLLKTAKTLGEMQKKTKKMQN